VHPSGRTILVVGDDSDALAPIRMLLEREGHRVLTADSGAAALDLLAGGDRIQLMLVDYFMPVMEAEELIRGVWTRDRLVQIVLQTGYAGAKPPREMVARLPIQGYHDKSDGPERLLLCVDFALKAYDQLAQLHIAERLKTELLANVSHEFRTPLNVIVGYIDLLREGTFGPCPGEVLPVFDKLNSNAGYLLELVEEFLDLSKVEASQLELERTAFSLGDLLGKVTEMVAVRAGEKGLALVCDVAPNVPTDLIGDPTRLRQVLLNLLGNAIKFTESGEVALRVTSDTASTPGALRFAISDTGIGIPEDKLGVVFERFTQADSSTTRRFGGSGLGLTISKRLVELMGGQIRVESGVGEGSVFSFTVPLEIRTGATPLAAVPVDEATGSLLPALRILLVEDSPDNRAITVAYLRDTPYVVHFAENGAVACEKFASGSYDLVLMDRQMPVMDGLTATRAIREWERANQQPPTPIVALTASALKGDQEQCMAAGCTAYLTKPIKQDVLLQAIREHSLVAAPSSKVEASRKDAILVHANPKIADLVPEFLQNRRQDVIAMLYALERDDFATVESLGHGMKGAGGSWGFQAITDIGAALEQAAESADSHASRKWVGELSQYLDRVEVVSD